MRVALAAHDEVMRAAIERHGGWLFKHTGDGVCAAFASPRSAIDAAVTAQRGLELPVRMGIATGEAELRGADYFGAVLNRAARVMAADLGRRDAPRRPEQIAQRRILDQGRGGPGGGLEKLTEHPIRQPAEGPLLSLQALGDVHPKPVADGVCGRV